MSEYARLKTDAATIERSPDELERDIERTRERMSSNLDELGDRLNPENLKRQAKDAIAGKTRDAAAGMVDGARATAMSIRDFVAGNPLPVTAVTLGVLSALVRRRSRRRAAARRLRAAPLRRSG